MPEGVDRVPCSRAAWAPLACACTRGPLASHAELDGLFHPHPQGGEGGAPGLTHHGRRQPCGTSGAACESVCRPQRRTRNARPLSSSSSPPLLAPPAPSCSPPAPPAPYSATPQFMVVLLSSPCPSCPPLHVLASFSCLIFVILPPAPPPTPPPQQGWRAWGAGLPSAARRVADK